MAMPIFTSNFFLLLSCLLLSVHYSVSEIAPVPVPSPEDYAAPSQPFSAPVSAPENGSPESADPVAAAEYSPPAPSPSDLNSNSPSSALESAMAPSPTLTDINHSDVNSNEGDESSSGDGGMSGGKKAGITVGVMVAACLVGVGGVVYKKRQDNIRRSQYGYAVGAIAAACLVGVGGVVYKKTQDNIRRSQYGYAGRREIM